MRSSRHITELVFIMTLIAAGIAMATIDGLRSPLAVSIVAVTYYIVNLVYAHLRGVLNVEKVVEYGAVALLFAYLALFII